MDTNPEAAVAPEAKPEATPNTNPAPAAPDMHGFTSDELAEMRKFYDSRGGFDKVKSMLSNPQPKEQPAQQQPTQYEPKQPTQYEPRQETQEQLKYHAPIGSITTEEFLAQTYANSLSRDPAFAPIADEIASGAILKDMARLNIRLVNQDGSLNDGQVREYLRLKAATVAPKQTSATPEASAAPTVEYAPYDEKNMTMQQAMAILQQDSALKTHGQAGHPNMKEAEEFMRNFLNKGKK